MDCRPLSQRGALHFALLGSALMALFVVGCGGTGGSTGGSGGSAGSGGSGGERFASIQDATPLPRSKPEDLGIEPFVGEAVVNAPIPPLELAPHPYLNNTGDSRIHNDHYNSAVYNRTGPVGPELEITTNFLGTPAGVCAMMTMLENGYVVGSCLVNQQDGLHVMLLMIDNENLNIVAERDLGSRPFVPTSAGGAYFSMDKDENFILGPATNKLEQYHIEVVEGSPQFMQDYSVPIPGLPMTRELIQASQVSR